MSPPPGFDPRTVHPVASRYTDWATRPTQSFPTRLISLFRNKAHGQVRPTLLSPLSPGCMFHCCCGRVIFCRQVHVFPSLTFLPSFVAHTVFPNFMLNSSNPKVSSSYSNWWYYLIFLGLSMSVLFSIQHWLPTLMLVYWPRNEVAAIGYMFLYLFFRLQSQYSFACVVFCSVLLSMLCIALSVVKFLKHVKVLFFSFISVSLLFWYSHLISFIYL
jgi:hypothetical protein